ncbi:facilitated trehalose transporter Tret1 isoform X1 [Leptinotarsa decemlineata]|uniref:facilitated trehalose transporter Tret1 isoform X1 n=1 Tax=Leptinotarsa decemlineata TaxID=7539 RepID=UPI003D306AAE
MNFRVLRSYLSTPKVKRIHDRLGNERKSGALASMSSGINASWTSPFISYLTSNSSTIPMTSDEAGWCAIAPALGCVVGPPMAALLVDRIGRKKTVLALAPVVFFSQLGIGLIRNVWILSLFRLLIGAADGAGFTALPMYIGEISSPDIRGFLSSLICLFFTLGVLLINTIGCFLSIFTCSLICAAIPAIQFLGFVFMPESPYYYIKVKKFQEAEQSLKKFTGLENVEEEMKVLSEAVREQEEMVRNSNFTDLFVVPRIRKATFIFIIIGLALRASAKAPLLSYTKVIFDESGSDISSSLSTITYYVVEFSVMTFTTYFVVDRFGKKKLSIISLAGCAIALFLIGLYFYLKDFHNDIIGSLNWLPLASLVLYSVMFNIGLAFAQVCYLSELFPTNVKAKALSCAEISTVITNAITVKLFQVMNDKLGSLYGSFFCFSALSISLLFFVVKYVPETRGMTLEEVQSYLTDTQETDDRKVDGSPH